MILGLGRVLLVAATVLLAMGSDAEAEQWFSRHGQCYQYEGRWTVEQDQSGLWTGVIDYVHVGGSCEEPTHERASVQVRAVVSGKDFFAYRTSGAYPCHVHGLVRAEGVSGFELCLGMTSPNPIMVRFGQPEDRPGRRPRE